MNKKALCIGINNYPGTGSDLAGCVNDANDWKTALEQRGFSVQQLLDQQATKAAMYTGIQCLIQEAQPRDVIVITYSGHGSWVPDDNGDEADGRDEVLCPFDITRNGPLSDDELYDLFQERKPGVRIVLIFDSCHSGTAIRVASAPVEATGSPYRFLPPEKFLSSRKLATAKHRAIRSLDGTPRPFGGVLLSGCEDWQYSFDAVFGGRPNGAFTYFALKALDKLPVEATYSGWYKEIQKYLPNTFHPQNPRLQGSRSQRAWKVFE